MSTAVTDGLVAGLPNGLWHEGTCHRQARLRPLTGADEAWLLETSDPPARRTSELLGRCVLGVGSVPLTGADLARALTVGDREALVLHLRRLTSGDDLPCTITCPGCAERLDLPLTVGGLLLPVPVEPAPPTSQGVCPSPDGRRIEVEFRLATGADQEEAAAVAATGDPDRAAELLLRRCLVRCRPEVGTPSWLTEFVDGELARLDAQAELNLTVHCPGCGLGFTSLLDAGAYLADEITRSGRLYEEIHRLALHYHWSERELMGMTRRQRARYLGLIEETFAGTVA